MKLAIPKRVRLIFLFSKQIEHYKRICQDLRNQNDALRYQLKRKDAGNILLAPPIPDDYDEMGGWTHTYLAGRLILLGRARRELKTAAFEDVGLVYRSLLLLAFEYRDMRMGLQDDSAFRQKLAEYGLECTGAIDPMRAGHEGDTYYVNYPSGSTQKEFLKFHLCKGTSRDPRYCLRIYFFWDEDAEVVVVGSLPGHLDNQLT